MVLNISFNENAIAVLTTSELVAMDSMRSGLAETTHPLQQRMLRLDQANSRLARFEREHLSGSIYPPLNDLA